MAKTTTRRPIATKRSRIVQTVKVNGVRTRIVTTTKTDGTVSVTTETPEVLEIDLQIAAVREMKRMPEYVAKAEAVRLGTFTLAADQNGSGKRGRGAGTKLKAAGMAAGEPDVRVYFFGGVLRSMEFKGKKGRLEESQKMRFPLLRALGFEIVEIQAETEADAAHQAISLIRGWLSANDDRHIANETYCA